MLEGEFLLVRDSGEIPEVALYSSLHYLCDDEEGPRLILSEEELQPFQEAVVARYMEIIHRDLDVRNRDLSLFRGVRRARCNWDRLQGFCKKIGYASEDYQGEIATSLCDYLRKEKEEISAGTRRPSLNCTASALLSFVESLALDRLSLPEGWELLCEKE